MTRPFPAFDVPDWITRTRARLAPPPRPERAPAAAAPGGWWREYAAYLRSDEWREDGAVLHCHHLPGAYARLGREEPGDIVVLCSFCHESVTVSIRERRESGRRQGNV